MEKENYFSFDSVDDFPLDLSQRVALQWKRNLDNNLEMIATAKESKVEALSEYHFFRKLLFLYDRHEQGNPNYYEWHLISYAWERYCNLKDIPYSQNTIIGELNSL